MHAVGATPATATTATRETCMGASDPGPHTACSYMSVAGKAALAVPPTAGYIYGYTIPLILFY
jgi:hypothetical protein